MTTESEDQTTWCIIAVTALSHGWRNVYHVGENGSLEVGYEDCPAILLMEALPDPVAQMTRHLNRTSPIPRTRAVFASIDEFGELVPAADTTNYLTTIAPGVKAYPESNPLNHMPLTS